MTNEWLNTNSKIAKIVESQKKSNILAYRQQPFLIKEHFQLERNNIEGGYAQSQVYELIQNGADALSAVSKTTTGKVHIVLTDDALYCANEGMGIDSNGIISLTMANISYKNEDQIGRFGLGFKSVLRLGKNPEFYSKPGSFKFDEHISRNILEGIVKLTSSSEKDKLLQEINNGNIPTLRIAIPLNPDVERTKDDILDELMKWAETVVKAPITNQNVTWLSKDFAEFPPQFLLFTKSINELIIENKQNNILAPPIKYSADTNGYRTKLMESKVPKETWYTFSTNITMSDTAKQDYTMFANRPSSPITWAVPVKGSSERGKFWSFFPMGSALWTTLSGIINAPWKMTADRNSMIDGIWNQELMNGIATLVVDNIPNLNDDEDPGIIMDILPARGNEEPSDLITYFVHKIQELAAVNPSIPDQNKLLTGPALINFPGHQNPNGDRMLALPVEALKIWEEYEHRPKNWAHYTCQINTDRYATLRILKENSDDPSISSIKDWLEALVQDKSVLASATAIRVAAMLMSNEAGSANYSSQILKSRIFLDSNNTMVSNDNLFIPGIESSNNNIIFINNDLLIQKGVYEALTKLGIERISSNTEFKHNLSKLSKNIGEITEYASWELFWEHAHNLTQEELEDSLTSFTQQEKANIYESISVKTMDNHFTSLRGCLLPGNILTHNDSNNEYLIDIKFHEKSCDFLERIGASEEPTEGVNYLKEKWYQRYLTDLRARYIKELPGNSKPNPDLMDFHKGSEAKNPLWGPIEPLRNLDDESKVKFTINLIKKFDEFGKTWNFTHKSNSAYPTASYMHPTEHAIRKYGHLYTSLGIVDIQNCIGPKLCVLGDLLPIAKVSIEIADKLSLKSSINELDDEIIRKTLGKVPDLHDDKRIGEIYSLFCREMYKNNKQKLAPNAFACRRGNEFLTAKKESVVVVTEAQSEDFEYCINNRIPVIKVPNDNDKSELINNWGLQAIGDVVTTIPIFTASGEEKNVIDEFPALKLFIDQKTTLLRCSTLSTERASPNGKEIQSVKQFYDQQNSRILIDSNFSVSDVLDIIDTLLEIDLSSEQKNEIIKNNSDNEYLTKLHVIRNLETHAEKLLEALGIEKISQRLPAGLQTTAILMFGNLDEKEISRLALSAYGIETLSEYRLEFTDAGFSVPPTWAGSYNARKFVESLGFPPEFAGASKIENLPSYEIIPGPRNLPELHNYQQITVDALKKTIIEKSRGMVALPTGSGKTRVAIQGIVELIRDNNIHGPILWVVQLSELVEQAVQTWKDVWRSLGNEMDLQISRFYDDHDVSEYTLGPHVVVATIQKLNNVFDMDHNEFEWLQNAECLIIDEAHRATNKSYTKLLDWMKDKHSLIGLTATPFRGYNTNETRRLNSRFGNNRLEQKALGNTPYQKLMDEGYLAHAEFMTPIQGTNIELTAKEKKHLEQYSVFSHEYEKILANNAERNKAIINEIEKLKSKSKDWSILLFATSVQHAETLSALLNYYEIPAYAIHSRTSSRTRRHYIEAFRNGEIQVLTNYGVLTEGFDAPSVNAIFITRPVFTPNLYIQMIGRGLRGPKNGGKDTCCIWNVQDTGNEIDNRHAFLEVEKLWSRE